MRSMVETRSRFKPKIKFDIYISPLKELNKSFDQSNEFKEPITSSKYFEFVLLIKPITIYIICVTNNCNNLQEIIIDYKSDHPASWGRLRQPLCWVFDATSLVDTMLHPSLRPPIPPWKLLSFQEPLG